MERSPNLGKLTTCELVKKNKPYGLNENIEIAKQGGMIAKNTRDVLEKALGEKVISSENKLNYNILMMINKLAIISFVIDL